MYGINNFVSSFLMSIELQQTIGYGERAPTDEVSLYILQTPIPLNIVTSDVSVFAVLRVRAAPGLPVLLRGSDGRRAHRDLLRQDLAARHPGPHGAASTLAVKGVNGILWN